MKSKKIKIKNGLEIHINRNATEQVSESSKNRNDMATHLAGAIVDALCGQSWSIWSLCIHNSAIMTTHARSRARDLYAVFPFPAGNFGAPGALPHGAGLLGLSAC